MGDSLPIIIAALTCLTLGLILGWLLSRLKAQAQLAALRAELDKQDAIHQQKLQTLEQANQQLKDSFASLSQEALKQNREAFFQMAEQNLKQHQLVAKAEMDKREKSIEGMVNPIREALSKTEQQLREIEKERKEAYGSLKQHLSSMAETQSLLQSETRNLVTALRRPEVRGQWGELTLKRLAELAGMTEYCDFVEQESVQSEAGLLRPDMIVRMPDQRELIIDAKTPLDAYLSALDADSDSARQTEMARHARKVRDRVKELASKRYWSQFKRSPDYVVLFIPGDQFLSAALEVDGELLEYALNNQVILATPTSLIALLRAVAFGWRQQAVAENAEKIQHLGEELYGRIATFAEHLGRVGSSLGKSVEHFNKAVGSLDRNVLPGARKFVEMGLERKKELSEPEQIEKLPRVVESEK